MRKSALPADFVAFVQGYAQSAQFTNSRRLFRGLIFRWCLWRDGNESNALPGYASCPEENPRTGFPLGWSERVITDLCREAIRSADNSIRTGRRHAALSA